MKLTRERFLIATLNLVALGAATAQTADDSAIMQKVMDAMKNASSERITSTVSDRDSGKVVESAVVEREQPGKVHFVSSHNGEQSEIIGDGQRTLRRKGPNEPWKALPVNVSAMMNSTPDQMMAETFKEEHAHLKLVGDDQINGVAAKVYDLSEDSGQSKLWLAADNSRLLKVERDYEGTGPMARPKFNGDMKSLQAQLKAATAQHRLHSVTTFEYDPSIKITMPPQ